MTLLIFASAFLVVALLALFWYSIAHLSTCKGDLSKVKPPLIVFDFDGTICPSFHLFVEQVNVLADEYNLRKIADHEIEEFRNMHPKEAMHKVRISLFKLPFLLRKARQNVRKQLLELKPVPGIIEVLKQFKSRGYCLGILTSNSQANVVSYLQKYKIDFFDFIYTAKNAFGKENHLRAILHKARIHPKVDRVVYVGDEIRDMIAAKRAKFISVGVTWGYNSHHLLEESNPNLICDRPDQLLVL